MPAHQTRTRRFSAATATILAVATLLLASADQWTPAQAEATEGGPPVVTEFAYVTNANDDTVTPIAIPANTAGTPIDVGDTPSAIAITPDGATAYVTNEADDNLTPIALPANTPGTPIDVGDRPSAVAITPDGATAYVVNLNDDTVTPIALPAGTPGTPIPVGDNPRAIAITPDGATAYVTNAIDDTVTPIALPAGTAGTPIDVGAFPVAIAITPDGTTAYVVNQSVPSVTPIALPANTPGTPIPVGASAAGIAITPDGTTAYVTNLNDGNVTPIALPANTPGTPIDVGDGPLGIAITPDGTTAYTADLFVDTVTPVSLPATPGTPIDVGDGPTAIAIATPPECPGQVADEAQYRAALACFSIDDRAPHTIELTADITLVGGTDPTYTGAQPLTIDGNGHTVDATSSSRILRHNSGALLTVDALTALDGQGDAGGALYAATAAVTVTDSQFSGNQAGDDNGGAIWANAGPVSISGSTFRDNTAEQGGAVFSTTTVTVASSWFTGNQADALGGALRGATVTVTGSTLDDNTAVGPGGAIHATSAAASNSTLVHNTAVVLGGGGITANSVVLEHATVVSNTTPGGHGSNISTQDLTSFGSVVADPLGGGSDCSEVGSTTSTYSFSGDDSCGFTGVGDIENGGSPILGALRDNGGPTPSRFPLIGSPIPDTVTACSTDLDLATDQRGVDRPFAGACDLGAIEAVYPAHGFTGVSNFYEPTVRWITSDVQDPPLMTGFGNGTFRANNDITRGQAVRLLYRAFGEPDVTALAPHGFTDVPNWVENSVRWAKANGIFNGFQNNTFRPNNPISRGNYTRSLYQAAGAPDTTAYEPHGMTDITPFYENAVRWAIHNGLANGFQDDTYRTGNNINRGNAARIFYNTNRAPDAWANPGTAPSVTLFQTNLA